jgi:hypothetical protein
MGVIISWWPLTAFAGTLSTQICTPAPCMPGTFAPYRVVQVRLIRLARYTVSLLSLPTFFERRVCPQDCTGLALQYIRDASNVICVQELNMLSVNLVRTRSHELTLGMSGVNGVCNVHNTKTLERGSNQSHIFFMLEDLHIEYLAHATSIAL